jgi:xanthine dehydrogenase molybdenum-binding subunit
MPTVSFNLNGTGVTVDYDHGMHLLEVLREFCGITTVKDGCAPEGVCGCCTVLLDNRPALACLLSPDQVNGRSVTTLDGLPEALRRVLSNAFVQGGAIQCGFCTPGMVTRAAYLVERGLTADRTRIERALSGHLCRCTGWSRIVDAIQSAGESWSAGDASPSSHPRPTAQLGGPVPADGSAPESDVGVGASTGRYRGLELALGEKPFVADTRAEGMLHAAVVLSAHPRATLLRIDAASAEAMPGVVRVLTADDIPGQRHVGLIVPDWPVMVAAGETTRCVGDVLAIVVADGQHRARRAALEVAVEYRVHEPVTDPEAALDPSAPRIHAHGNLLERCRYRRGDVEDALAGAAHVVEQRFTTQRIEHAFLEPEACLAVPSEGRLTVYSQGQGVHDDQRQIASVLGMDSDAILVELVTNGGAFGGKEDLSIQAHTALAARLCERPVRLVLTRAQSMRMHPKRHPLSLHYTVAADGEGRLSAVRARIVGDTGAYASVGTKVLERAAGHCCGPYRVPNVDVEAATVYTNNPPCGAMRGFGVPQTAFAIEGILDTIAERVGIDGYDIRDRNILEPGDRFATGQRMDSSCGIRQTLEAVRDHYKGVRHAGIACGIKNTGIGNGMADIGRALIRIRRGGRLEVRTGYTEMGQGLHTILRQVVAHETGLDPDIMEVVTVSDPAVECGMTTASRATALGSAAARLAAEKLATALETHALEQLEGQDFHGEYVCDFTVAPGSDVTDPVTHLTFGYATQVVVLDDDGRIARVIAAHDVGRAINPLLCAGQIEGSVHMGIGYALSEDFPCTAGVPDSLRLRDLGILSAASTPPVDVILIEVPDHVGGYGSKGVGEIGMVPTAAAVAGALFAFDGVRRTSLPMSDSPAAQGLVPKSRRTQPSSSSSS